jgi:hypothetical protein
MKTSRSLTTKRPPSPEGTDARQSTGDQELGTTGVHSAAERHPRIAGEHELDDWLAAEREIDAQTAAPGASHALQPTADADR